MEQPKDMAALKLRILSRSITLAEDHERIARVTFDRPDMIAFGTVKSVADIFAVSPSTILRLTQALGFASFRDFRALFRDHLRLAAFRNQTSGLQSKAGTEL